MGGVTIPKESVEVIVDIVKKYFLDYLLLEQVQEDGYIAATPKAFQFDVGNPPEFLVPVPLNLAKDIRLYEIVRP